MRRTARVASGLAAAAWLAACGGGGDAAPQQDGGPPPIEDPTGGAALVAAAPDQGGEAIAATFSVVIGTEHPDLGDPSVAGAPLEPVASAIAIEGEHPNLRLTGGVKRLRHRVELVRVELFFHSALPLALRDVEVRIEDLDGVEALVDLGAEPFGQARSQRAFSLGRVAAEGVGRLTLGVPVSTRAVRATVRFTGTTTARAPAASSPLALSPDGAELWVARPDADQVAIVDTVNDGLVATLDLPGRPRSVAMAPDGAVALVALSASNAVAVIDRASRTVIQTLTEAHGIGREPRHVVFSPDGTRAWVSALVSDEVSELERTAAGFRVGTRLAVGRRPSGLAVSPDGDAVIVSHFLPRGTVMENEGWLSVLATGPLRLSREVVIHDHFNLGEVGCIADVFGVSDIRMTTEGVASQLAGAFFNPAGTEAWVPGVRVAGSAVAWERGPDARSSLESVVTIRPGEFVPPFVFIFDTRTPLETRRKPMAGATERPVAVEYMRCVDYQLELEFVSADVIPSDPDRRINRFLAFPTAVAGLGEAGVMRHLAFTRGGRRALLLSHTADEIVVQDAITHHPAAVGHFGLSGHNPTGVVVSADGARGWVTYENSPFVSVLDLAAYADPAALPEPSFVPYTYQEVPELPSVGAAFTSSLLVRNTAAVDPTPRIREVAQVSLGADPMDPVRRRGRVLFTSANPDKHPLLSASRNGACASCHPDGGADGSMWATMEGERRTMSLRGGVAGRGWLHASGTHRDIDEFVRLVVPERLGGGLADDDYAALSDYVAHGIDTLQAPRTDPRLVETGAAIFQEKCAGCHEGAAMTSGRPDPADPHGGGLADGPLLHDVGSATDDAHVLLSPFFESLFLPEEADLFRRLRGDRDLGEGDRVQALLDFRQRPARAKGLVKAPSLVNVAHQALFFHDGRYDDLADAIRHIDGAVGLGLSEEDVAAVAEYLKTL